MPVRNKKNTRRGRKPSRKMTRKVGMRRMRGGGASYSFTVTTPISPASTVTGFPADLGAVTVGNQSISFTNPTKSIVDIKVKDGATPYGATSFSVGSATKVAIQIGTTQNIVPNGIAVRGAMALPGAAAAAGQSGAVVVKGLGASSFGKIPATLTFEVFTSN